MLRPLPIIAALSVAGALAAAASTPAAAEVVLYRNANFGGYQLAVNSDTPRLRDYDFNNLTSSIIVNSGYWQFFAHSNYNGDWIILGPGSYPSVEQVGFDDNEMSSLRYLGEGPPDEYLTLYRDGGFGGSERHVFTEIGNLHGLNFNNETSSLVVRYGYWDLFENPNFGGFSVTVGPGGYPDLGAIGFPNDALSSLRPALAAAPPAPPPPPSPPSPQPAAGLPTDDCLPYNPSSLTIADEGASGWLLTDGRSRMLTLDTQQDALAALALAQQHTAHCFIGRGNQRPNRSDFVHEFWAGYTGGFLAIASPDCISYNRPTLTIVNEGANGWLLTDGGSRMIMLDDQADAQDALALAQLNSRQCFIGRGNQRAKRDTYIVEYWLP